ncbi:MAG TPA: PilX N-terminal domain-containing pilus assembly protein [Steroidobacteraceae bacterium]
MRRRQGGAALVVGLIMLVILTLLAITSINTSSTELVMAGNEQFRERAFHAAEVGIERALRTLASVPQTGEVVPTPETALPSLADDTYEYTIQYVGEDQDIPGYSAGKFVGLHYRVESTGRSLRNSVSVQQQGAFVIAGNAGSEVNTPWLPGAEAP